MTSKIHIIIPAGGASNRFGDPVKKQFQILNGETILNRTLKVFLSLTYVDSIVVSLPKDDLAHESLIKHPKLIYTAGGKSRSDSVHLGFEKLDLGDDDLVLIHDAARPLISEELVQAVIAATHKYGSVVPVLAVADTVKTVSAGFVEKTIPRETIKTIQTPQGFRASLLKKAYSELNFADPQFTDESLLIERLGLKVAVVEGERQNIKITEKFDFQLAQALLSGSL